MVAVNGGCTGFWECIDQLINMRAWDCDKMTVPVSFDGELE